MIDFYWDSLLFAGGQKVELIPGFKTESAATFDTYIDGCVHVQKADYAQAFGQPSTTTEVQVEGSFSIAPNPIIGQFQINTAFDQAVKNTITIMDVHGRVVYEQLTANVNVTIDLTQQSKSINMVMLVTPNSVSRPRIIEQQW